MKTATLQHPSTSRVHAQSYPHNDVYWPPRCILKPPCSEQTTRKLRPHTSRPQKAILAWRRAPVVVHLLSRWVCSLGGREGKKRIMFGWCCLLLFLLRGAAFHPLFFGWYRLPFPPLFWEAWCCCSSVDLRVVRLPTVLLFGWFGFASSSSSSFGGVLPFHLCFGRCFLSHLLLGGVFVQLPPHGCCCFPPSHSRVMLFSLFRGWCCLPSPPSRGAYFPPCVVLPFPLYPAPPPSGWCVSSSPLLGGAAAFGEKAPHTTLPRREGSTTKKEEEETAASHKKCEERESTTQTMEDEVAPLKRKRESSTAQGQPPPPTQRKMGEHHSPKEGSPPKDVCVSTSRVQKKDGKAAQHKRRITEEEGGHHFATTLFAFNFTPLI